VRTDTDGLTLLRLPSWLELTGTIDEEGFGAIVFRPTALHDTPETALVLRLQKCAALRGKVLDRADAPIADARIELECYESELGTNDTELGSTFSSTGFSFSKRRWGATTDAEGKFEIAGLPPGPHLELTLRIEGEVEGEDTLRLEPGEERSATYRVGAGALLRGVLFDADGATCAKTRLVLMPGARSRRLSEWERDGSVDRTNAEGAFEFADVAPGDWLVGPKHGSRQIPWLTHVHAPEGTPVVDVVLRLPRAQDLRGRTVGPAGEAVPNVRLQLHGDDQMINGTSDDEGAFHFEDLVEGSSMSWPSNARATWSLPRRSSRGPATPTLSSSWSPARR